MENLSWAETKDLMKFRPNRPLSERDRMGHLSPKEVTHSPPWPQATVIKMNSTYLECCDIRFGMRGIGTFGALISFGFVWVWLSFTLDFPSKWAQTDQRVAWVLLYTSISVICPLVVAVGIWLLSLESTLYHTHCPQRFNRKTRMVHVFLEREKNGIVSIPWDEVYFTWVYNCVRGYQLAKDGETVLARFDMGQHDDYGDPWCFSQWEFVRRYMEEGPEQLEDMIDVVMNVSERRETYWAGLMRLFQGFGGPRLVGIIGFPLALFISPFRWLGMRICPIPVWPKEIEDTCQIEPDDPYIRDAHNLAPRGAAFRHMEW